MSGSTLVGRSFEGSIAQLRSDHQGRLAASLAARDAQDLEATVIPQTQGDSLPAARPRRCAITVLSTALTAAHSAGATLLVEASFSSKSFM